MEHLVVLTDQVPLLETNSVTTLLLLAAVIVTLIIRIVSGRKNAIPVGSFGPEIIPTLKPKYPIIGNVPFKIVLSYSEFITYMESLVHNSGELLQLSFLHVHAILIKSAPLAQVILKSSDFGHITKHNEFKYYLQPLMVNGIGQSEGHTWKRQRKLLMQSQKYSALKHQMDNICWHSKQLVEEIKNICQAKEPVELHHMLGRTLLCIIIEMQTNFRETNTEEVEKLVHAFDRFAEIFGRRLTNPIVRIFWRIHPLYREFHEQTKLIESYTKMQIKKFRDNKSTNPMDEPSQTTLGDLIEEGVPEQEIITQLHSMIGAAHDTSTLTLQYFLMCMAVNPEIQQKCRIEVDELFKSEAENSNTGNISFDAIQGGLKYLERCILETLRLFPPGLAFGRRLTAPIDIDYNGKSVRIPGGWHVIISPYLLHRMEEYFPNPYKFDPDRFLSEVAEKRHQYAYIPFSAGPRNCLGQKFAILQLKALAAYLLKAFEFDTPDKMEDIPLLPSLTLKPERNYKFFVKQR